MDVCTNNENNIVALRDFIDCRATWLPLATLRNWIAKAGVLPTARNRRTHLYNFDSLIRVLTMHGKDAHQPVAPKPAPDQSWVRFPIGAKIGVTNAAGVRIVGRFNGYKGDVFGRLLLQTEETIFGRDSIIELARSNETVAVSDWRVKPQPKADIWLIDTGEIRKKGKKQ